MEENKMMKFETNELEKIFNTDLKNWISDITEKESFITEKESLIKNLLNLNFITPSKENVFNAFKIEKGNSIIEPKAVKVLILGQDPYPDVNDINTKIYKAHGYAFSVPQEYTKIKGIDASLLNIFKAISYYNKNFKEEFYKDNTNLINWARNNGILLLNIALTHENSEEKTIKNHRKVWKDFIQKIIIKLLTADESKLVVFLWGDKAQTTFHNAIYDYLKSEDKKILRNLLVLATSHPSNNGQAVKRGFCYEAPTHFEACDKFLGVNKETGKYIWKDFPENNK